MGKPKVVTAPPSPDGKRARAKTLHAKANRTAAETTELVDLLAALLLDH